MKLRKVFSCGNVLNEYLYHSLKSLDQRIFCNCEYEFWDNRDWWVILDDEKIVGYCGCLYRSNVCIFVRAWVHRDYRGNGLQKKMIRARVASAKKKGCHCVVTYTTYDNFPSANNLIKCGFLIHDPAYPYAGKMLYFKKNIQ